MEQNWQYLRTWIHFFSMSTMETILIHKFSTRFDAKDDMCHVHQNLIAWKYNWKYEFMYPADLLQKSMSDKYFFLKLKYLMILMIEFNSYINFNMHMHRQYISILKCYLEYTFRMTFSCDFMRLATCLLCGKKITKA